MTADQTREHAKDMELAEINFLDALGRVGVRGHQVRRVHLVFIDGNQANLTVSEFKSLDDVTFKLRPKVFDA